MGDASGRTFDNADAEYAAFWEGRIGPLLGLIDDQLDVLTGSYADDLWLRHDTSDVWVLSRHERAEQDRAAANLDRGALTLDDYREAIGLERLDVAATRVLWIPQGKGAVAADEEHADDAKEAAGAPVLGVPSAPDPGTSAATGAARGAQIASYNAQTNATASRLRLVAGEAQGRPIGGGAGAFERRSADDDTETKELNPEGEQSRARDRGCAPPTVWR